MLATTGYPDRQAPEFPPKAAQSQSKHVFEAAICKQEGVMDYFNKYVCMHLSDVSHS